MFLDPSKLPYFLFVFRIELGLSTVIGNDDEIDTNICISFTGVGSGGARGACAPPLF